MQAILSNIQKEPFEKVPDRQSELADPLEQRAFTESFCLAMKMMVDILKSNAEDMEDLRHSCNGK